jgi:hypothetical protein
MEISWNIYGIFTVRFDHLVKPAIPGTSGWQSVSERSTINRQKTQFYLKDGINEKKLEGFRGPGRLLRSYRLADSGTEGKRRKYNLS